MLNIFKFKENKLNNTSLLNNGNMSNDIKHHPASTKQWFNSIYLYNRNNIKNLPSIDVYVIKTIKNYFNMFSLSLEKSIKLRKKAIWKRRFKLNKILISKPEFKHTNDKVTIILYIYNRELSILKSKIKKIKRKVFAKYFLKLINTNALYNNKIEIVKKIINNIRLLKRKIKKFKLNLNKRYIFLKKKKIGIVKVNNNLYVRKSYLKLLYKYNNKINYLLRIKLLVKKNYLNLKMIAKSLNKFNKNLKKNKISHNKIIVKSLGFFSIKNNIISSYLKKKVNMPNFYVSKLIYIEFFKDIAIRLRYFLRYYRIMKLNLLKFNLFIKPLNMYLEKIYKKNVSFNIISLKSYHLNSSILMQVLATKLRNRKNRINRLLPAILSKVKIPITRRLEYFMDKPKNRFLQNIYINKFLNKNYLSLNPFIDIYSLNNRINTKKGNVYLNKLSLLKNKNDKLDMIIKSIYPLENNLNINNLTLLKRNYKNVALDIIPNKAISGIRIEASGRLSKRLIAARAIFKMKQIGTIRNINSSYKKIPSMLLKGNLRSNVQFNRIKNKTRIGSFGLKGWVSST